MTARASETLFVLLLLSCGAACESSSSTTRDGAVEDGGRREPDAGDGGEVDVDASDLDASDVDSRVDELVERDSGADSGPTEPRETLALTGYCEQMAALYYEFLHDCYGDRAYPDSLREQRVAEYRSRCMQVEAAIEGGRVAFDEQRAHEAVEAAKVGGCARQFGEARGEGAFRGLVEPGGACYSEETLIFMVGVSACADGYCDEEAACPGTCRELPARGEDCADARCRMEDYCDVEGTCRARKADGERCAEPYECGSGLACTEVEGDRSCQRSVTREGGACSASAPCGGVTACIDGACTFARELGERCMLHSQCPEDSRCILLECAEPGGAGDACATDTDCRDSFLCDTALDEPACVALPAAGEACLNARCEPGSSCRYDVDDGAGTCRAQVAEGESCLVGALRVDDRCQPGLHCVEQGTCELPGELGEPCGAVTPASCVEGLWCSRQTYTCELPAAQGEACNPSWLSACDEGLGCTCGVDDITACSSYPREHQVTDTCQPLIEGTGECFRSPECASGSCLADFNGPSDVPGACAPTPALCLP